MLVEIDLLFDGIVLSSFYFEEGLLFLFKFQELGDAILDKESLCEDQWHQPSLT